jgi:thiol:disulfide interchange protein DsbC
MKKHCTARLYAGLALFAISATSLADTGSTNGNAVEAIKSTLHARYPEVTVVDVKPAAVAGWYEVFTGNQLVYSDATADHVFVGKLLDTQTRQDLAAQQLEKRLTIDFQSLPFECAIKIVRGSGTQRLALFEDPDCPYCQALEQQLAELQNVTLYVFLFPLSELHPEARVHAHAIWCAPDRAAAWTHWMLEHKAPGATECSADPIDQLQSVGKAIYVTSTPTIFLPSGQRIQGVVKAAQLQKLLEAPTGSGADTRASTASTEGRREVSSHEATSPEATAHADSPPPLASGLESPGGQRR